MHDVNDPIYINDANSNNIVVTDKTNEIKVLSFFSYGLSFRFSLIKFSKTIGKIGH